MNEDQVIWDSVRWNSLGVDFDGVIDRKVRKIVVRRELLRPGFAADPGGALRASWANVSRAFAARGLPMSGTIVLP